MKFRNLVFVFIAIVILVAWFTKPDYDEFIVFQQENAPHFKVPPVIDYSEGFLFSRIEVTYYAASNTPEINGTQQQVAIPIRKESYIGVFGKFWAL